MSHTASKASQGSPTPHNLPAFLIYAVAQYSAPYTLHVIVEYIDQKPTQKNTQTVQSGKPKSSGDYHEIVSSKTQEDLASTLRCKTIESKIDVKFTKDRRGKYIELTILRCERIPRLLMQIIALCIPFHPTLNRIACRYSPQDAACFYELSKCLHHVESRVTEIILDDSPVRGSSYHLILEQTSHLSMLSLARCGLDDDDVVTIAKLLSYPRPSSFTIKILNLSTNRIGDRGAHAIGDCLRTNRYLQYLNLSGNHISSEGGISILNVLMQFHLTDEELADTRIKSMNYLLKKKKVYEQCLADSLVASTSIDTASKKSTARTKTTRSKADSTTPFQDLGVHERAQWIASELVGENTHPFANHQIMMDQSDGRTYSFGNMALCCLSLAFNNLDYTSLPVLIQVLTYQSSLKSKKGTGLLRIQIEGNNLPVRCDEYNILRDLLDKTLTSKTTKPKSSFRTKSCSVAN